MNKKLPKCLSEVKVDGDDRLTSDKKPFLIYDNNSSERILIFASEMGLKMLSETFVWHADGTFYSASKYFAQLYILFAHYPERSFQNDGKPWVKRTIPCVWVLMKRRRKTDYDIVWGAIIKECQKYKLTLNPKSIMIDFELAAKLSFESFFPNAKIRGCLWHFGSAIFK